MKPRLHPVATLAGLLSVLGATEIQAISSERVLANLAYPTLVTAPVGDSRLFLLEQAGRIRIFMQNGTLVGTFLDIDSQIEFGGGNDERGLLGMAFSPDYANDGLFYLNYTNNAGDTVISRWSVSGNPNVADPLSEEIILAIDQPFSNHNGGRMVFGPNDDLLYIGMGDGGSGGDPQNNGQSVTTLLGKILRIDVSGGPGSGYTNPSDNPFFGVINPGRDEIWAYGLRNPWGVAFDVQTGDMYIADVGQNAWEEVNVQPASSPGGENYGWRIMEGNHCFNPPTNCNMTGLTLPVHEYSHSTGCSISGGAVYRGVITEIQGLYFFGDFCSANIWSFRWNGGGGIVDFTNRTSELAPNVGSINSISAISTDGLGEMYIVDRGSGANGELFRVIPAAIGVPSSTPPSALIVRAAPNPFLDSMRLVVGFQAGDTATLTIIDAQGRLVRRIAERIATGGDFQWDGRDERGNPVAAGTYTIRLESGGEVAQATITRLR